MILLKRHFLYLVLIFTSCQPKSVLYDRRDMENTIPAGSKVSYEKEETIEKNNLVVFDYYDKRLGKNMSHLLRVVGLPGDTIEFINGILIINRSAFIFPETSKLSYLVKVKTPSAWEYLNKYSSRLNDDDSKLFFLTIKEYKELQDNENVDSIYRIKVDSSYVEKILYQMILLDILMAFIMVRL